MAGLHFSVALLRLYILSHLNCLVLKLALQCFGVEACFVTIMVDAAMFCTLAFFKLYA